MRRLALDDDLLADYDPEPARRTCRHCSAGRHDDCRWDRCGCGGCNPDDEDDDR